MSLFSYSSEFAFGRGRGSYANPHATIAIRDIPINIKHVMRLCRFYYSQDSLVRAIIDKVAEYPITELVIESDENLDDKQRRRWDHVLNAELNLRAVLKRMHIQKFIAGVSAHYLHLPFVRYCVSRNTGRAYPIKALRDIRAKPGQRADGSFTLIINARCEENNWRSPITFDVRDSRTTSVRAGLNLTPLDPLRLDLEYNPASGARDWYWEPPKFLQNGVMDGVRVVIATTEMKILEAVFRGQKVRMNPDRLWIALSEGLPGVWEGWGFPPMFPALEDIYYYKILRRANEALAQEHVTPLRIVSPRSTGDISAQRTLNLTDWQERVRKEIQRFRMDPNHVLISPMPVEIEQMGGNARVMMVASELEAAARFISAAIGCPIEMVWGGLNWSGGSISLRVLENHFLREREDGEQLIAHFLPRIAKYFQLPPVRVTMSKFKMADDVQQMANSINLMLQGFLDRRSVLTQMGFDPQEVFGQLTREHIEVNRITMEDNLAASHMNTVIQALEAKAQVLLQYDLQMTQEAAALSAQRQEIESVSAFAARLHQQGKATPLEFIQSCTLLSRLPPMAQQGILNLWSQSMPYVTHLLMAKLQQDQTTAATMQQQQMGGAPDGQAQSMGAAESAGMEPGAAGPYSGGSEPQGPDAQQPLPEQRPPQRERGPM